MKFKVNRILYIGRFAYILFLKYLKVVLGLVELIDGKDIGVAQLI